MTYPRSLAIQVLLVIALPNSAKACVCSLEGVVNDRDNAAVAFSAATVVFEGEALPGSHQVSRDANGFALSVALFRVIRPYKGNPGPTVEIYDQMAGSDCSGPLPEPGKTYFVEGFAHKDGKLYVEACVGGYRPAESAAAEIRFARGEPATTEDLMRWDDKWRLERDSSLAKRGATLRGSVQGGDAKDLARTMVTVWPVGQVGHLNAVATQAAVRRNVDAHGAYEVRYLPPGEYEVTATAEVAESGQSAATRLVGRSKTLSLIEGQTLQADVALHPEPLGTVSVHVVAPPELHDRVVVQLRDDNEGEPYPYSQDSGLDNRSVATFHSVPYALYTVYVRLRGEFGPQDGAKILLNASQIETTIDLPKNFRTHE